MSYDVLVTGEHVPELLQEFLAKFFGVPLDRVFVGAESEMGNWDQAAVDRSLVSSSYEPRSGALAWYLSIYADPAALPRQPSEADLSRRLSAELNTVTLFPEGTRVPDVFHFVTGEGTLGFARFNDDDTDICEVSRPVPEFPAAAVAHIEDEVRGLQLPTPVTDRQFRRCEDVGSDGWMTGGCLIVWERLAVRLRRGWPPLGWYGAELYEQDLESRDDVTALLPQLAEPDRAAARTVLDLLDAAYRDLTVADSGAALIAAGVLTTEEMAGKPWYWRRRPNTLPW